MDYEKYRNKAKEKLAQYGTDCVIKRKTASEYDEETNEYSDTFEEINGKALISSYAMRDIDGTNIKMGDISIMCVLSAKPTTEDTLEIADKSYIILDVDTFSPDGTTDIFYRLHSRGA